ncbi:hypothetical protein Dimus_026405 [Dionaea muscipula]
MDLGCLDLGCISLYDEKPITDPSAAATADSSPGKDGGCIGSNLATANSIKNKATKDCPQSSMNALNRFTSQIKKPPRGKTSPLNWFPRKKVDSYLKRKIKLLQEAGGMNSTLVETLGDSNPHYCRVEREKIAAREAARKAMEARKAAMVEASWCRILRAARIQSKEAEAKLLIAEKNVAEALEAATAKGVIMYDTLDCPRKHCVLETLSVKGKASSLHTIRASFETGFDVDKQVAAAVKAAFIRLANCPPSSNKDEFKDLLRRISENPDAGENGHDLLEFSSGCESDMELDSELETQDDELRPQSSTYHMSAAETRQMRLKTRQSPSKSSNMTKLVDMMYERLKCLQEDELASLATIVATCGLNAVLAEVENFHPHDESSAASYASEASVNFARRKSTYGPGTVAIRNSSVDFFMNGPTRKKQVEPEFPTLDKFLVKHMTKLEREVEEVKNSIRSESSTRAELANCEKSGVSLEAIPDNDLGSMLVKHSSKLGKEIEKMKRKQEECLEMDGIKSGHGSRRVTEQVSEVPSLDKFLVKHVSRLEREVQEAKNRRREGPSEECQADRSKTKALSTTSLSCPQDQKENYDVNKKASLDDPAGDRKSHKKENTEEEEGSLDKILLKPVVHGLEKEKLQALGRDRGTARRSKKQQGDYESLDKVLVKKHVSRLEKEKMELPKKEEEVLKVVRVVKEKAHELDKCEGGLDQILVKHKSRLEREKFTAVQDSQDLPRLSVSRREARERELHKVWGGMSLSNSIKPHVSRLQRDKAAWLKAEEEERKAAVKEVIDSIGIWRYRR